ncbi:hypothetical protein OROMI_023963 [Orobanche minor]
MMIKTLKIYVGFLFKERDFETPDLRSKLIQFPNTSSPEQGTILIHDQGLAEEADNSMQEDDQDYLDFGRSHGRIHKVLTV